MSITPKQVKFNQESDKDILNYLESNDIVFGKYVRELIRKDMQNQSNSNDLEKEIDKIKQELKELKELVLNGSFGATVKNENEEACTVQETSNSNTGIDALIF